MKFKYYFIAACVACLAGFTSCSDDEPADNTPTLPEPEVSNPIVTDSESLKVKIGTENAVPINVTDGGGEYKAYSLDPTVADVFVGTDGKNYVEGFKNGTATVVITDAANQYKTIPIMVYTTDVLQVSTTDLQFNVPMGKSGSTKDVYVTLGNGQYSIESDDSHVSGTINSETGEATITATAGSAEYTATVTISDVSGLTADVKVNVIPSFDPFTDADIQDILAISTNTIRIEHPDASSYSPLYFSYYPNTASYWKDEDADGNHTFGWWYSYTSTWGNYDYGGMYLIYPAGTTVGQEVDGTCKFQYYSTSYYGGLQLWNGTVKVLKDEGTKKTVIWWDVDMENETINRGYIVRVQ